jgi:hypothetical protein
MRVRVAIGSLAGQSLSHCYSKTRIRRFWGAKAMTAKSNPMPGMRHSFTGRVRNFNLPPTASNCMMPVFEAVTNALYAI